MNACRNGKQVNVVIELQARFDEESNIYWSRRLEEVGANIYFGIPRLKVHAKLLNITRYEDRKLVNYSCVSTGNFHEGNALVYSDLILFTSDKRITSEAKKVFEFFAHTYRNQSYRHLIVSPLYMRKKFYKLIDGEIKNRKAGKKARIILKINNLVDNEIIYKLYQANNAGVEIILIIRGICSLIPGIPGMSENINAISIVDKFLEHSRIMIFHNNGDELFYISSADWMGRNLDRRIEIACPIYSKEIQQELRDLIDLQLRDNVKSRIINEEQDNQYVSSDNKPQLRSQFELHEFYRKRLFE
jgi:polyphosphate kinase